MSDIHNPEKKHSNSSNPDPQPPKSKGLEVSGGIRAGTNLPYVDLVVHNVNMNVPRALLSTLLKENPGEILILPLGSVVLSMTVEQAIDKAQLINQFAMVAYTDSMTMRFLMTRQGVDQLSALQTVTTLQQYRAYVSAQEYEMVQATMPKQAEEGQA